MTRHQPTALAESSLFLHRAHAEQRAWQAKLDAAEPIARAQLAEEGKPLTVRNIVTRQYEIARDLAPRFLYAP